MLLQDVRTELTFSAMTEANELKAELRAVKGEVEGKDIGDVGELRSQLANMQVGWREEIHVLFTSTSLSIRMLIFHSH
jgi:hypothetical protein